MRQVKSVAAALEHYVFYPEVSADKYATIVALHGRGANAGDLVPIVEMLDLKQVLLVTPQAPLRLDMGLMQGFEWYNLGAEWTPDPETFIPSLERFQRFLSEIKLNYPIDPDRLYLLGFSQGTVMAYGIGLQSPSQFKGIVGLSGYVPTRSQLPFQFNELGGFPIFISHGTYDEVIPVQLGREAAELLSKAGANVVYREYSMGHQVSEDTLKDLSDWTKKIIT